MLLILKLIFTLIRTLFKSKEFLIMELMAKSQQLSVYENTIKRVKLKNTDRKFWVTLSRIWPEWKRALVIVKPETVIRWHRKGFKYYWKWLSRRKSGRPVINWKLIKLIRKISRENPFWGNMRIRDELKFLGIAISLNTIKKYRFKHPSPPSQNWKTFLKNHMESTISIDMFTVPSVTFGVLYGFIVLSHERRKILFSNVTYSPNGQWLGQQMINTFFEENENSVKYLIRDRDSSYSEKFRSRVFDLDIEEVITAYRSPWQNAYVERVIGSIKRECTNHMIILSENHLRKMLNKYVYFYNNCRPHQGKSMEYDVPVPREFMMDGKIITERHAGGLQHCYKRAA